MFMADVVHLETGRPELISTRIVLRLQILTIAWMLLECAVALVSSWRSRSPLLLAFGSDSLVELLSAGVVLLQYTSSYRIEMHRAARWAGVLLYLLAGVVTCIAIWTLFSAGKPEASWPGIAITVAALIVMPLLSRAKRKAAAIRNDRALAADAVQSAVCAYLAGISLLGLAANALLHLRWIDPVAALVAVPVIVVEARRALRGDACGCC